MNQTGLLGRLVEDPELRHTNSKGTAVVSCTLAVERGGKKDANGKKITDFIPIVIWGKEAEKTATYCRKGSQITVENGCIQSRSYESKDGTKRYVIEVIAGRIGFVNTNAKSNDYNNNNGYNNNDDNNSFNDPNMTPTDNVDGDIPF